MLNFVSGVSVGCLIILAIEIAGIIIYLNRRRKR